MSLGRTLEHRAFRLVRAFVRVLPERWALGVGALLGVFAGTVLRIRRGDVDRHLALAFPDAGPRWRARVARASYAHLGREAVMLLRVVDWPPTRLLERVRFDGLDDLATASQNGTGAVVLTGHIGNWEIAGAALAASGIRLDAITKRMSNPRVEADVSALRHRLGVRSIEASEAPKEALRSLRNGRVLAILGDQNAAEGGVFVPFFGLDASTARGPALFALRTGAPVLVGVALRAAGEQRYEVTVRKIDVAPSGDLEKDVRALLAAYHETLEEAIRGAPEQYFWQHKRWKTRPTGQPSPPR